MNTITRFEVEQIEAFEERLNIRIDNISIKLEDTNNMKVFCEVFPSTGSTIVDDINIVCILYDKQGSIFDKQEAHIYSEDFYGFEVIDFCFWNDKTNFSKEIGKVRIYPKK